MEENEILVFDPTSLSIFKQEEIDIPNISEEEIEKLCKEQDALFEKEEKRLEQKHINNCLKHRKFYKSHPLLVYLAGKIEKNGWRESIVGYRCGGLYGGESIIDYYVRYNHNTIITGPWFLACDHGCYHGDNTHGVGMNTMGDPEAFGDNYSEKQVYDICLRQIDKSNVVFAYIDDNTCYGSIYEIAYAKAKGKHVVIIFDNEKRMSNMWFMCQGADIVEVLKEGQTIKEKFDEILNAEY